MKKRGKQKNPDKHTYTKNMVTFIIVNAIAWVYLTYVLAFVGREQIAETLAVEIVKVIIGVALLYLLKATLENIFKHKAPKIKEIEEETLNQNEEGEDQL